MRLLEGLSIVALLVYVVPPIALLGLMLWFYFGIPIKEIMIGVAILLVVIFIVKTSKKKKYHHHKHRHHKHRKHRKHRNRRR